MQSGYWSSILSSRLSRRRALAGAGGATAGALLLAACGGGSDSKPGNAQKLVTPASDTSKSAKKGGTLKLVQPSEPPWLDPGMASQPASLLQPYVYSQLLRLEPGHLKATESKPVADIAESWEFSPDGLTMTMKLRQGVKWHNRAPVHGRVLDAADIEFSWNRLAEKGAARGFIANSANPSAPVLSFTATDAKTITVKLKEPTSYITAIFAYQSSVMPILPKEADTQFDPRNDQIGTGPFMLDKYTPSVGLSYTRNPDYYESTLPYAERVELPIVTEYAARLSQFKAGNIHALTLSSRVNGDDILVTKRDVPQLVIYEDDIPAGAAVKTAFGWLPEGKSPWLDERVRQAYSMAIDRDAWIDTVFSVQRFQADGLPVKKAWNTCINASFAPSWIDPRDANFGPNAKYFKHDVAEAKKLLAAAGYPSGFEFESNFPDGMAYGAPFDKQHEIISGMVQEAGLKPLPRPQNFAGKFIPSYRDGKGQHTGVAYKIGAGFAQDPIARMAYELYSKGGLNFYGFSASGKNDQAGDPAIDSLIDKAKAEFDDKKRQALAQDIQREMGKKQWMVTWPGAATGYLMAWPAVQNFQVFREDREGSRAPATTWWLDESKAPLAKA